MKIIKNVLFSILFFFLSFLIKRDEKYIALGSWMGNRYVDNSRYLAEYIHKNHKEYTIFWVGENIIKEEVLEKLPDAKFLEKDKFSSGLKLLRCKYMFFSQMHNADISSYNVFRKAVMCYLHHGMPLKKWAADGLNQGESLKQSPIKKIYCDIVSLNKKYDFFVTSSPAHDITNCSALAFKGCTMNKNVHSGTPRNDMFFNPNEEEIKSTKLAYSERFSFNKDSKVFLYLPTYRRISNNIFSLTTLSSEERERLTRILVENNIVLIEKSHFSENVDFKGENTEHIVFVDKNVNVQEMMLFSDCIISDYSGAFLDFILLNRPVIHFVYDYEYYKNIDSGLYYELDEFAAGNIACDFDELLAEIDNVGKGIDNNAELRKEIANKFMTYEQGTASQKIFERVVLNEHIA